MGKNFIATLVVIVVVIILIVFVVQILGKVSNVPSTSNIISTSTSSVTVTYTDAGFSPQTVNVNVGGTVDFVNQSSHPIRVASNPHPIHNSYPTAGGCVSSTFDSCVNIAPGQSWSFVFNIRGTWGYHDHLNPTQGGVVVVQ